MSVRGGPGRAGWIFLLGCLWAIGAPAQAIKPSGGYAAWSNGPSDSADWFPIGVWLQSPRNANRYKNIGVNLYVGLYDGPTEQQLEALEKANMPVICGQNNWALDHLDRRIIVGWMQEDEPDNAQLVGGRHYGPPVTPDALQANYDKMHNADPTRPIYLNFGQGVAWDGWTGRGNRTNEPGDYLQYVKSGDILSFDFYPAASAAEEIAGKLWMVPAGVERLREWSQDRKFIWNCIETTRISNPSAEVTPLQVKTEVWMSIIHGSRGVVYFAHQFAPHFVEAGLLADSEMAAAVGNIDAQIQALTPVLNSATIKKGAGVTSSVSEVPVDIMVKQYEGATYVFAVAMRDGDTRATFSIQGCKGPSAVTALGEDRTIVARDGQWEDAFGGFGVHIYRMAQQ